MSSKFNKLFEDYIWRPYDYTEVCWMEDGGYLSYNIDNNVEDLMRTEGETFGGCIKNEVEIEGYVLLTVDSEQGWEYQAIFSVEKKVDSDKYWDEQEEDEDE